MMPSIENIAKNGIYIDNILRRVNDDGIKRKKFMHRMLEEKQLPYKKRWIPTVFLNLPQTFRPKYERPMTRSQRRRSSANKENCSKSKRNEMKIKPGRKTIGRRSVAQNDENSTSENEIETISATPESAVDVKEVDESFKPITVNVDENSCILEMKYFEIESTRI